MKVVILVLVFSGIAAATHPIPKKLMGKQTIDCRIGNIVDYPDFCVSVDLNVTDNLRAFCEICVGPICRAYEGATADECGQELCDSCSTFGVMADSACCGGGAPIGAIAGGVAGGVVLLIALLILSILIICCCVIRGFAAPDRHRHPPETQVVTPRTEQEAPPIPYYPKLYRPPLGQPDQMQYPSYPEQYIYPPST